jgi:hypothetical protein
MFFLGSKRAELVGPLYEQPVGGRGSGIPRAMSLK